MPHLILVPGLICDHAVWKHQARTLESLATIEVADHGSLDSLAGMAKAILDRAPDRFAIAGHSMGGRVAMEVSRLAPERVARIALMDTAYRRRAAGVAGQAEQAVRQALLDKARKDGMRAMGAQWAQNMVLSDRLSDALLMNAILDMIERKTPEIFEAQIKALLTRPDATPVLRQIQCPAMILCGRQDSWSVLSQHEEMAALIPHSRLVVIENCGHMSTMEQPEAVTAALRTWLEGIHAGKS